MHVCVHLTIYFQDNFQIVRNFADRRIFTEFLRLIDMRWKKFHEYLPILTGKRFLLKLKSRVYATCVRSCLMHGSETWPMKVEHELKVNRTEISMIKWMCGVKLNERKKSEELRELLGLEPVSLMTK